MFRHLSPKGPNTNKQTQQNNKYGGVVPSVKSGKQQQMMTTQMIQPTKDIKNLNNFLSKPQKNTVKKINMPVQMNIKHTNSSTDNLRPVVQPKTGTFDDYYEKKPKPMQFKNKKQDNSMSGDSYQSQGYQPVKKFYNASTRSIQQNKGNFKSKNLVVLNNQEQRSGFKSPPNLRLSKPLEGQDPLKRVGSFGTSNKRTGGRLLSDQNVTAKKGDTNSGNKMPISPQPMTIGMKAALNTSDKKEARQQKQNKFKLPTKQKTNKKVPFPTVSGIKSSPFLAKMSLNSSNELSGQMINKKNQKPKLQPLLSSLKKQKEVKDKKSQKSLSFNKGQKFMQLKKRQEHHTKLNKQLNVLGIKIPVKVIGNQKQLQIQITLVNKLTQSKNTAIYLAHHSVSNSLYCVKRINVSQISQYELSSIINEHKIHQNCRHPHIVKYFCTAVDTLNIYQFMQFMQEGTLGHQLKKQILDVMSQENIIKNRINQSVTTQISKVNKIRRILYEILSALSYLHERNIVHRDIKPENIFVSYDIYKLGDFGSASFNHSQEYVGTLDYAAPQILTQKSYDHKIDIWSLGCVAYQLIVGRPPFFHINQEQTKRLAIEGEYDKSLICDTQLRSLIEHSLARQQQRWQASSLLKHQFFSMIKEQIVIL